MVIDSREVGLIVGDRSFAAHWLVSPQLMVHRTMMLRWPPVNRVVKVALFFILALELTDLFKSIFFATSDGGGLVINHVLKHEDTTTSSLMQNFPHCFPSTMTNYTNSVTEEVVSVAQFLKVLDVATFTLRDDNSRRHDSYNHMCFIMKSRYNCALPPGLTNNKHSAQDYKFIYEYKSVDKDENVIQQQQQQQQSQQQSSHCDLEEVIDWLGGPTGIGRALAQQSSRENVETAKHQHYQVLLQGDSRLRQVIESLICQYQDEVTNLTLTFESPDLSINAIKQLKKKHHDVSSAKNILNPNEMGQPRNIGFTKDTDGQFLGYDELLSKGCHNSDKMSDYYYPGVTVPTSIPGCSDDLLMVEFGVIRFYFIFQPQFYSDEALLIAYEKLGLTTSIDPTTGNLVLDDNIDVVLWNLDNPTVRLLSQRRHKNWYRMIGMVYMNK